jgi:hypothetical protein
LSFESLINITEISLRKVDSVLVSKCIRILGNFVLDFNENNQADVQKLNVFTIEYLATMLDINLYSASEQIIKNSLRLTLLLVQCTSFQKSKGFNV